MLEDMLTFASENAPYMWVGAGFILLSAEMILPGVYLMWLGFAALFASLVAFVSPDAGFAVHGSFFGVAAIVSVYVGNRFFYGSAQEPEENDLNERGEKYVGQTFTVETAITDGRGAVKVGDTRWLAHGPDTEVGALVRVVAVDGTVLTVEAA